MPDAFHVFLLACNALVLSLGAAAYARTRASARDARDARDSARVYAESASGHDDRAGESAGVAERHANRAAREATRAINANVVKAAVVTLDVEPDVIPFTRPGPTGPRLADLDEPA